MTAFSTNSLKPLTHQLKMDELAGEIIAGTSLQRSITLDCTPGGGKTGSATLLANRLLDAGLIDRVLWVVPRLSLAEQVQDAFQTGFGSNLIRRLEIVDGGDDLFAPTLPNQPLFVGCVTTYQTIAYRHNWERFANGLKAGRGLIIFDEVQFLNEELDRGWMGKALKVKEAAVFTLLMSGTLWRTDDKRIALVDYAQRDGKLYPISHINYTLQEAVAERAVLPTEWRNRNGIVEYNYNGAVQMHDLLDDGDDEESRKVRTFLDGDKTVGTLLDSMVEDWRDWRRRVYPSRMIVMAENVKQARRWRQYLHTKHGIPCVLATCREEAAGRNLRHFRERKIGQCLVTVAMAYVGFDCPDLSHLAYLSNTRAPSWMLQSFARVSRCDRNAPVDYDHQHAFVYAPDDERMRRFMAWLRHQQEMGISMRRGGGGNGQRRKDDPVVLLSDDFKPIDAAPGDVAIESLHRRLNPEVEAKLAAFAAGCPAAMPLPHSQLYEILLKAGVNLSA